MAKRKRYVSNNVLCPYYKSEDTQLIYCTGVKEDTALHLGFSYPADKVRHMERYCEDHYGDCDIARMLEEAGR